MIFECKEVEFKEIKRNEWLINSIFEVKTTKFES